MLQLASFGKMAPGLLATGWQLCAAGDRRHSNLQLSFVKRQLAPGNWQLTAGNWWQLAIISWQSTIGKWQLTAGSWPLGLGHLAMGRGSRLACSLAVDGLADCCAGWAWLVCPC